MRITLIYPNPPIGAGGQKEPWKDPVSEPLVIGVLASMVPPNDEVIFYDNRVERIDFDEPTDLVAISTMTLTAKSSYEIAARYRQKGVPVVLGGFHPTLMPEEASDYANAVCIGVAETAWPTIIADARRGSLKRVYKASGGNYSIAMPQRDIFKGKRYFPVSPVEFGRGCPHSCDFCCVAAFYKRKLIHRPVSEVVDEISKIGKKIIFFTDDNIISNKKRARSLFNALIPLKIRWVGQSDVTIGDDEELLDLAVRSGCAALLFGFESLDEYNLKKMAKTWNIRNKIPYDVLLDRIKKKGIMSMGHFIFGYDNDTLDSFKRVSEFVERNKLLMANFWILTPFPKTPLYERLKLENRLLDDTWWLSSNIELGKPNFVPCRMDPDEIMEGYRKVYQRLVSFPSIIKRLFDHRQANSRSLFNMALFLRINFKRRKKVRQISQIFSHPKK